MNYRTWTPLVLVLVAALAACDRDSQPLPFSVEDAVSRTVPAAGAVVSSAAGASVQLPAGAVDAGTTVTLAPTSAPAVVRESGTPVSTAFQLEPAGLSLQKAATVELRFSAQRSDSAWLASVVNVTPTGIRENGDTRVDLSSGLVESRVRQFGTLAVVIPERSAIFPVTSRPSRARGVSRSASSAALLAGEADSVSVHCGDADNRCSDLTVSASSTLTDRVENAALVYPLITGTLRINGAQASGRITLDASFRVQLKSGATAENVVIGGFVEPTGSTVVTETASEIRFSSMRFFIAGSAESGGSNSQEIVQDLVIAKDGSGTVTITRDFRIGNGAGGLENAFVSVTFPIQIHN